MSVILGLLILCLGAFFLGFFFQVARLEKIMTEGVTILERYMIGKYSLGVDKSKTPTGQVEVKPSNSSEIVIPPPRSSLGKP